MTVSITYDEVDEVLDRLVSKIDRDLENPLTGCWTWNAYRDKDGYGLLKLPKNYVCKAHHLTYVHEVGPIPEGLELDHLCMNRSCVRPDHLEPVTHAENMRRASKARTERRAEFGASDDANV